MTSLTVDPNDKYFRLLSENSIVGIVVLSSECKILFANEFFCSLIGFSKQELHLKSIGEITHKDDVLHCTEAFKSIFSNGKDGFQIEKRYISKNGNLIWCEMSISANRSDDGSIELFTGIINDISKRKQIENELIASQNLFSTIFKNSPVAFVLGSIDTQTYLDVNESFVLQMGYSKNEVIGKKSTELSFFENDQDRVTMIEKVKETGFINGYQVNCKKKSGEIFTVLFSITIVTAYNQTCLLLTAMDISERISFEKALKESEQNYKKLVDFLPDGIAVHQKGKIVFANDYAIKLFEGTSELDFIGKSALDLVHSDFKEIVKERINKTLDFDEGTPLIEEVFVSLKGKPIYVEVASLPFSYTGNHASLVVFREISSRKIAENELIKAKNKAEESDRLKSAFLANMSHEIRTPMNAIKGFAQLLEDPELTLDKRHKFIKIINQRTDDLLMLINDILDTAKIEAGQMSIVETTENVDVLLNEICQFFIYQQELLNDKRLKIKIINNLEPSQTIFTTDFFRLRQILINLLNNAIKFTDEGYVNFGCKLIENNTLLFFVEDSGIGIPEDKKDLVFAPFRQLNDSQISRQHSGTGLGLSIVNGLLKLMDGKVWFNSIEGKGTTFYFSIPFKQETKKKMAGFYSSIDTFDWKNKTILLVEDDEFNAQLIIEFLLKTNVRILHVTNGLDAIKIFKQNPTIDITLMDIQLPDINGFELTQMFKSMNRNCVIIAQTAYAAESDKKRAISSGCIDYISKPIVQDQLLKLIQLHLK